MLSYEPLHITAHLRTPVICDEWLPLDALLYYQAFRDHYGPQDQTLPGGHVDSASKRVEMPLAILHAGEPDWYYACSFAWPHPWWKAEGQDYWNKRFDSGFASLVDFGQRRGSVNIQAGPLRAYHMLVFYRSALSVEWYCRGHEGHIKKLLSTLTHIGKKTSQGWGRVARWEMQACADDWSVWRDETLMRAVPLRDLPAGTFPLRRAYYGIRPSYYMSRNQMQVALP